MESQLKIIYQAVVIEVSKTPPYYAGYLASWIRIKVRTTENEIWELYMPYLDDNKIPKINQKYNFSYSITDILDGWLDGYNIHFKKNPLKNIKMIGKFQHCECGDWI